MKNLKGEKLKQEIGYVAEVVDLSADLKKQVENYSGGDETSLISSDCTVR